MGVEGRAKGRGLFVKRLRLLIKVKGKREKKITKGKRIVS